MTTIRALLAYAWRFYTVEAWQRLNRWTEYTTTRQRLPREASKVRNCPISGDALAAAERGLGMCLDDDPHEPDTREDRT